MIEIVLAQPAILPPTVNFRTTTKMIPKIDNKNEPNPAQTARFNGASEKLINPSNEYFNKLQKSGIGK